jgi:hypothetical protein
MADAYLMTWNEKKIIARRVAASELYESLLSLQPTRESPGQESIISAKKRIDAKAAQLESPIGTWSDPSNEVYQFTANSRGWVLRAANAKLGSIVAFSEDPLAGRTFRGQAHMDLHDCKVVGSGELQVSEHGTRMELAIKPEKGLSMDLSKPARKACEEAAKKLPVFHVKFIRLE